jgi:phosphonoacetaldehyde hydrolase
MMEFRFQRTYRGPLKGVIVDWAGTTVDFGSFAPVEVFMRVFEARGVPITMEQARAPMGLMKKDHIRAIVQMPKVAEAWKTVHSRRPNEDDVEAMFGDFVPRQIGCLTNYADPIRGVAEVLKEWRRAGLKIGSTTGYSYEMMDVLVPEAARRGFEPDEWVCPSDVPAGRPYPWMAYENAIRLGAYPMQAMVKIGDTLPDIDEGLNAGMWTIGVALSGNELGLTEEQFAQVHNGQLDARREDIARRMYAAGAHYVVDGIWDCAPAMEEIRRRVAYGERP